MKTGVLICLLLITVPPTQGFQETAAFEKARQLGEWHQRSFFLFSTSTAKYVIRNDGMGEISAKKMHLIFHLKVGAGGRVEQIYFREYQGDLLLLYEVSNGTGYLTRLNPQTRKRRWLTPIDVNKIGLCSVEAEAVSCGPADDLTTIDLKNGAELKRTASQPSSSSTLPTPGSASLMSAGERRKAA